jgi:hypothetical protein
VETGDNLGEMTSELKPNENISKVVCAGPKNYAYRTVNPMTGASKTVCKVSRTTLNYHAFQLVSFAKIKVMILSMNENETVIYAHRIRLSARGEKV